MEVDDRCWGRLQTRVVVMSDTVGEEFFQKIPANLDKMKVAFYDKHATSEMSFTLVRKKVDHILEVYAALVSEKVKAGVPTTTKDTNYLIGYQEITKMDVKEDQTVDTIFVYALEHFHLKQPLSLIDRLSNAIGGENGAKYIHRLLYDLCRKVLCL
ncbi:hypothetical protein Cgig2_027384 [Carnegiea gigantea]|uniref:Uncharacterized protein n=1 Tax=Carnegiea gigantea TaxID=171969 RepID=A0A9Q1K5D6_9CARY|nr:hypothetical protein Cgig2_027384 [Carnegiea gigantea]